MLEKNTIRSQFQSQKNRGLNVPIAQFLMLKIPLEIPKFPSVSFFKKGVHVVTVNDYLARRDAEWVGQPLRFLGMTVGVVQKLGCFNKVVVNRHEPRNFLGLLKFIAHDWEVFLAKDWRWW